MSSTSSARKPRIHVTTGGTRYVDAEELLRSEEAQRVLKKMERMSMARTSSEKPTETDRAETES